MNQVNRVPYFGTAIEAIYRNWSGLQLAVHQGAGGHQSREKGDWLVQVTENWFYENNNLQAFEVADFLEQILQDEFNLCMEDGSVDEVSSLLCQYFQYCVTATSEQDIVAKLQRLPKCDLSLCQSAKGPNDDDDDEDEDVDDDPHHTLNNNIPSMINGDSEGMEMEDGMDCDPSPARHQAPIIDEDGFQMVPNRRRRR